MNPTTLHPTPSQLSNAMYRACTNNIHNWILEVNVLIGNTYMTITSADPLGGPPMKGTVTAEEAAQGMTQMILNSPKEYEDLANGVVDANLDDIVMQYAVFGEILYK